MRIEEKAKHMIEIAKKYGRKNGDPISLAVDAIVADISDRRGLKGEWAAIEDEIRMEIRGTWEAIIRGCLTP